MLTSEVMPQQYAATSLFDRKDDGFGRWIFLEATVFPSTKKQRVQVPLPQRAEAVQDILHRKQHTEAIYTKLAASAEVVGSGSPGDMCRSCLGPLASVFVDSLFNGLKQVRRQGHPRAPSQPPSSEI